MSSSDGRDVRKSSLILWCLGGGMLSFDTNNASTPRSPSIGGGFVDTGLASEQSWGATQRAAKGLPQGGLPNFYGG